MTQPTDETDARRERESLLKELESWSRTPMLVLSAVWLILLLIELTRGASSLLDGLGMTIWAVFVLEFALRLVLAPRKGAFVARNWLTVLSLLLPALRLLRVLRTFRVLRLARAARGVRLVRIVGGLNRGMGTLRRAMKRRGLGYVLALTLVVTLLGAAGMRALEGGAGNGGFDGYGEALWWTTMIMTTLGSDAWPRTLEGRILCVGLSLYAFAVFGYITAAFASFFVDRDREGAAPSADVVGALHDEIVRLRLRLEDGRSPP